MWSFLKKNKSDKLIEIPSEIMEVIPMSEDIERLALKELKNYRKPFAYVDYWLVFSYLKRRNECKLDKLSIEAVKGCEFCADELNSGKQLVWICPRCYTVIGFFKAPIGIEHAEFSCGLGKIAQSINISCPLCKTLDYQILKSSFLLSGKTILFVQFSEFDNKNNRKILNLNEKAIELFHLIGLQQGISTEKYNEDLERKAFEQSFNDLTRKIGIHKNLLMIKDEDGKHVWTAFGRFPKEAFSFPE